jgi:hypothetical protein
MSYKLMKRVQVQGPVGPYEVLEFKDSDGKSHYARMESDSLDAHNDDSDFRAPIEEQPEFQAFLDSNFNLLHYYMD